MELLLDGPVLTLGDRWWAISTKRGLLLALLAAHDGFLEREDIYRAVLGDRWFCYSNPRGHISVLVNHLRKELGGTSYRIITGRNIGYKLVKEDDGESD